MSNTRTNQSKSEARSNREDNDRPVSEDRALQDEERLAAFRQSHYQSALPDLPKIPGYHVCWLTTNNARDSIQARERLGYEAIKSHEVAGWEHSSMKSGPIEGCISVNEMVAYKLPQNLYQAYMKESHHDRPLQEEQALSQAREEVRNEMSAQSNSEIRFEEEEGFEEMGRAKAAPTFS